MSFRGWPPRVHSAPASHVVTHRKSAAIGRLCPYCSRLMIYHKTPAGARPPRDLATADHVIPRMNGGRSVLVVCLDCNNLKGSRTPVQWIRYLVSIGRDEDAARTLRAYNLMSRQVLPGLVTLDQLLQTSGEKIP